MLVSKKKNSQAYLHDNDLPTPIICNKFILQQYIKSTCNN